MKHDNCLLGQGYELKITDFGYSKRCDLSKEMQTRIGTTQYAAPEVLSGKKYNALVDIFSLGVMLFVALSGTQPWRQATKKDKWYIMAYKGKWDDFWNYHTRKHTFDDK